MNYNKLIEHLQNDQTFNIYNNGMGITSWSILVFKNMIGLESRTMK